MYSHITLIEINQIPDNKFKLEHINVLEELDAKYLEPKSKLLSDKKPTQIWADYIVYLNSENDSLELKNIALTIDNLSRKASGLPIKNSFEGIGENLEDSIKNLSQSIIDSINSLDLNFNEKNLKNLNKLDKFDHLALGPKPFREHPPIKNLNISELSSSEVVFAIENVFNEENTTTNWTNNFNDSIENKISRAYTLMNWAGYYPDDFDKIKKNKDRFRASNNDIQHASIASNANFLISNDNAFRMKAIASYKYTGVNTIVCSSENFIEEYNKFKNILNK